MTKVELEDALQEALDYADQITEICCGALGLEAEDSAENDPDADLDDDE